MPTRRVKARPVALVDIMQVPPELILRTQVIATYRGGKPVFERAVVQ